MKNRSLINGVVLIALGGFFLANNFGYLDFEWHDFADYWPWAMIVGGILFWTAWLSNRKDYGLLMPGTILLIYGGLFLYNSQTDWWYMDDLWPIFILGPGVGFLAMYFLGKRDNGLLVTGLILCGIGVIFLGGSASFRVIWPLILIGIGLRLLFKHRKQTENETASS